MSSIESVSVVIPCYRSTDTIGQTVDDIASELGDTYRLELILVNDGSPDNTWEAIEALHDARQDIIGVNLMRNFGEHNAVLAGMRHATGDAVIVVDDDLQHPASEIIKLLTALEDGHDVVYGKYNEKKHGLLRNLGSAINNAIAGWVLDKPRGLYLSSFKAIRGVVAREVAQFDGPFVYLDGLLFWTTTRMTQVTVEHRPRAVGESNYNLRRLVRLHMNLLTGFSVRPLRLASGGGLLVAATGLLLAVIFFIEKLHNPELPVGWASLIVTVLVVGGVNMIMIGIIGEYVGRIFLRLRGKPQAVEREVLS